MPYVLLGLPLDAPKQPAQKLPSRRREGGSDAGGLAWLLAGQSRITATSQAGGPLLIKELQLTAQLLTQLPRPVSSAGSSLGV